MFHLSEQQNTKTMTTLKNILWRNWFGFAIALVVAVLLFRQCEEKQIAVSNFNASENKLKNYQNQLGTLTSQVYSLQFDKEQLESSIINKDKEIKKLSKGFSDIKHITTVKTVTKYDTVFLAFDKPIPCDFVREGSISQDWFSLNYRVDSLGVLIDSLTIPNRQIIVSGYKRLNGFFSPKTLIIEVTNTNPHIENISVQNSVVSGPKKWYETTLFKFTLGFGCGILMNKL